MSDVTLAQIRPPDGGRLMGQAYLTPGGQGYARVRRYGEPSDVFDATRSADGELVVVPARRDAPTPTPIVCPAHGVLLAWAYLPAGETTIVQGWCRRCNAPFTLARIVTAEGDVVVAPSLDPRRMRGERTLRVLLGPWAELLIDDRHG